MSNEFEVGYTVNLGAASWAKFHYQGKPLNELPEDERKIISELIQMCEQYQKRTSAPIVRSDKSEYGKG